MSTKKHVKGGYEGPKSGLFVRVRQNADGTSDVQGAMRKLTKLMQSERWVQDTKRKKHFVSKGEQKRADMKEARKRHLKDRRMRLRQEGF